MEESLVSWVNTFSISKECAKLEDLCDGIILGDILAEITPVYFDPQIIKREAEGNDFLKINNLKKIIATLEAYYKEEIGLEVEENVDATTIVREENHEELSKLIQLMLGAAVECENKVEYIQRIMQMNPSSQRALMVLIEGIMNKHQLQKSTFLAERSLERTNSTMGEDELSRDIYTQRIESLEQEKRKWQEEYEKLQQEHSGAVSENTNLLSERETLLSMVKNLEEALENNKHQNNIEKEETAEDSFDGMIKKSLEQEKAINENHKLHTELEEKEQMITEMRKRIEELSKVAAEARLLRDEVDILREKSAQVEDLEDRLKKALKKAEAVVDLRKQLKAVEEQSEQYLKSNLELEESAKKLPILKAQVDKYKEQVTSLMADTTSLRSASEQKEAEMDKLKEQLAQLTADQTRKNNQLQQLQRDLDQLKMLHDEQVLASHGSPQDDSFVGGITDLSVKEKLMRLELENKQLRASSASSEKLAELENKLDDFTRLNVKYVKDNEELRKRIKEFENGVISSSGEENLEIRNALSTLQLEHEKVLSAQKELEAQNKKQLEEINNLLKDGRKSAEDKQIVNELNTKLKNATDKINQMTAEKTKLEGYLRTAKTMIRDERAKLKDLSTAESQKAQQQYEETIQSLKNQMKEKEKEISLHKKLLDESRESSSREQKLMSSAVYELGVELQRLKAPKPDLPQQSTQPKSFLGQKRRDLDKKI